MKFIFLLFGWCLIAISCVKKNNFNADFDDVLVSSNDSLSNCLIATNLSEFENTSLKSYRCKDDFMKIQILENLQPDIDRRIVLLKTMFESKDVPYQGTITKNSTCLSQNSTVPLVTENEFEKKYVFNIRATAQFVFGSCMEEKDIYKTEYILLLCKKLQKAYEIKHFYPKLKEFNSLNIHCKE